MNPVETYEGEFIEEKVARVVENKEPIEDGAPIIYTERKDGVIPAYNIRTDKWDIALTAMDQVNKNWETKNMEKPGTFAGDSESESGREATKSSRMRRFVVDDVEVRSDDPPRSSACVALCSSLILIKAS